MASSERFALERTVTDDVSVVAVHGELDHAEAEALIAALSEVDGPLVVDLRQCGFMGSDGLRALLEGRRLASERGHRQVVHIRPSGPVARLLEVVGAETFFNLWTEDDLDGAIAAASRVDRRRFPDRRGAGADAPAADRS